MDTAMIRRPLVATCLVLTLLSGVAVSPGLAQKTESDKAAERQNREAGRGEKPGATLDVAPGPPIVKDKDIEQETKLTPWKRLPRYILRDQKGIWTSPFHTSKSDAKWWAI